jgi:hypothetical protein
MAIELSAQDKQALNKIEQQAAHGLTSDALKDLNAWTHSVGVDTDKQKLAVSELEKSGVLPVLGIEKLKEEVHSSSETVYQKRADDLVKMSSNSPVDEAIYKNAQENLMNGTFGHTSFGYPYEDESSLKELQSDIEKGRPAEDIAHALSTPDANGQTLYDKLTDPKVPTQGITPESIDNALKDNDALSNDERNLARKLRDNFYNPDVSEMADHKGPYAVIDEKSLAKFNEFHPQAPADLPPETPPAPAPAPAADAPPPPPKPADAPPPAPHTAPTPPEGPAHHKYNVSKTENNTLWGIAYAEVTGHQYHKGDHWTNSQNAKILEITKALQEQQHGKPIYPGNVVEIP